MAIAITHEESKGSEDSGCALHRLDLLTLIHQNPLILAVYQIHVLHLDSDLLQTRNSMTRLPSLSRRTTHASICGKISTVDEWEWPLVRSVQMFSPFYVVVGGYEAQCAQCAPDTNIHKTSGARVVFPECLILSKQNKLKGVLPLSKLSLVWLFKVDVVPAGKESRVTILVLDLDLPAKQELYLTSSGPVQQHTPNKNSPTTSSHQHTQRTIKYEWCIANPASICATHALQQSPLSIPLQLYVPPEPLNLLCR